MLSDKTFHHCYSQFGNHQPAEFCHNALSNSIRLDLGLGYFSSASFNVLAHGMAQFIVNGGVMNLYINKYVSSDDFNLLKGGFDTRFDDELINDFTSLKNTFEKRDEHFFQCLAFLIQENRINIRIIVLKNGGLPHEKYGIFTDKNNDKIYFNGSMNMTAYALVGNLETIECTCSWKGPDSLDKVLDFERHFHEVWNGNCNGVMVFEAKRFCNEIMKTYPNQDPEQLLQKELEFINEVIKKQSIHNDDVPHFPACYKNGVLPYQEEAYNAWLNNDRKGVFAMATGTGKTVTALNCALHEYVKDGYYNLLILVPTLDLVEQWEKDLKMFNYKNITNVSSLNDGWRKELVEISSRIKRGRVTNFVIISTYDSFVHKDFQLLLPSISNNTILIADEAHNIGGKQVKLCFEKLSISKRIGLSATPERIYDDDESCEIGVFFNDQSPYVYSFPMSRAISEGRLCRYYYYPKIAKLNKDEMELYTFYTRRLYALWDSNKQKFSNKKQAENILMSRKRVIHKCNDKIRVYREILREIGEERLKYTFVYSPQGKYSKLGDSVDDVQMSEDYDMSFIKQLQKETKSIYPNIRCNSFTGKDSKTVRSSLLQAFGNGEIDVLLAMKCLDEGVNIPRAEIGIFTSSTGNPREFIQRRGRLLRKHPEKTYSYIYDIVVIPDTISREQRLSSMESNLVKSELHRVAYFASLAQNLMANNGAFEVLNEVAHDFGIIWNELTQDINQ